MTTATDQLIEDLCAQAGPVRRQAPPVTRAIVWLAFALAILALEIGFHGLRPDLDQMLASPGFVLETGAGFLTGVLALFAAFLISVPDRSERFALLPVPALVLWGLSLGQGCYQDYIKIGPDGLALGDSVGCLTFISGTSLLLGLSLFPLLRRGAQIRPELSALMAGLAVSSLAASALMLFHHLSTAIMVLIWHGGAMLVIVLCSWALGRPVFFARPKKR